MDTHMQEQHDDDGGMKKEKGKEAQKYTPAASRSSSPLSPSSASAMIVNMVERVQVRSWFSVRRSGMDGAGGVGWSGDARASKRTHPSSFPLGSHWRYG